ncbi:hypothetical protein CXG81DRAFT_20346 [Caulochytrium protostelioides]|uniref:Nucleoporin protein Ndc1-Nup n=1 Tax=Caulochytrium protostelioides TaxID=1555241 RepID=A0A4P9X3I5_9FUNG|nr:hypothetical protein CXG81DRAFT_20346 [Caulochytrium protostelioides]|eukprot:RKO99593.1 hypothetical protein CXG81DRAFT_20346 [Caulochytrium protostelioides]
MDRHRMASASAAAAAAAATRPPPPPSQTTAARLGAGPSTAGLGARPALSAALRPRPGLMRPRPSPAAATGPPPPQPCSRVLAAVLAHRRRQASLLGATAALIAAVLVHSVPWPWSAAASAAAASTHAWRWAWLTLPFHALPLAAAVAAASAPLAAATMRHRLHRVAAAATTASAAASRHQALQQTALVRARLVLAQLLLWAVVATATWCTMAPSATRAHYERVFRVSPLRRAVLHAPFVLLLGLLILPAALVVVWPTAPLAASRQARHRLRWPSVAQSLHHRAMTPLLAAVGAAVEDAVGITAVVAVATALGFPALYRAAFWVLLRLRATPLVGYLVSPRLPGRAGLPAPLVPAPLGALAGVLPLRLVLVLFLAVLLFRWIQRMLRIVTDFVLTAPVPAALIEARTQQPALVALSRVLAEQRCDPWAHHATLATIAALVTYFPEQRAMIYRSAARHAHGRPSDAVASAESPLWAVLRDHCTALIRHQSMQFANAARETKAALQATSRSKRSAASLAKRSNSSSSSSNRLAPSAASDGTTLTQNAIFTPPSPFSLAALRQYASSLFFEKDKRATAADDLALRKFTHQHHYLPHAAPAAGAATGHAAALLDADAARRRARGMPGAYPMRPSALHHDPNALPDLLRFRPTAAGAAEAARASSGASGMTAAAATAAMPPADSTAAARPPAVEWLERVLRAASAASPLVRRLVGALQRHSRPDVHHVDAVLQAITILGALANAAATEDRQGALFHEVGPLLGLLLTMQADLDAYAVSAAAAPTRASASTGTSSMRSAPSASKPSASATSTSATDPSTTPQPAMQPRHVVHAMRHLENHLHTTTYRMVMTYYASLEGMEMPDAVKPRLQRYLDMQA